MSTDTCSYRNLTLGSMRPQMVSTRPGNTKHTSECLVEFSILGDTLLCILAISVRMHGFRLQWQLCAGCKRCLVYSWTDLQSETSVVSFVILLMKFNFSGWGSCIVAFANCFRQEPYLCTISSPLPPLGNRGFCLSCYFETNNSQLL